MVVVDHVGMWRTITIALLFIILRTIFHKFMHSIKIVDELRLVHTLHHSTSVTFASGFVSLQNYRIFRIFDCSCSRACFSYGCWGHSDLCTSSRTIYISVCRCARYARVSFVLQSSQSAACNRHIYALVHRSDLVFSVLANGILTNFDFSATIELSAWLVHSHSPCNAMCRA